MKLKQHILLLLMILAPVLGLPLCANAVEANKPKVFDSEKGKLQWEELTRRDEVIWGFDFLPTGEVLLTERDGSLLQFDPATSKIHNIKNVPKVFSQGQGGLLDVRVHPEFAKNSWILMTYSEPVGKGATTSVARAKLVGNELKEVKKIFQAKAISDEDIHFGSRIEFESPKVMFVTIGERNDRHKAQALDNHHGKILRIDMNGKALPDNPFVNQAGALPEIWSYGHRNPQGLIMDTASGKLWSAEFGPRGGDELNLVQKGKNYGWPMYTYGREYWGPKIGEEKSKDGFEEPVLHWTPSISPSGLALMTSDKMAMWKGDLIFANLGGTHLRRVRFVEGKPPEQEVLLRDMRMRFRHARQGPDGFLYVSTDDGTFARISPAPEGAKNAAVTKD